MSRALDDLAQVFRPLAFELLARCVEAGIAVEIICTGRTQVEQDAAVASGHSWVTRSKHQDGLAIDLCPFQVWLEVGVDKLQWDAGDPQWARIGAIGERLGLRWGGRWKQRDLGHLEYVDPIEQPTSRI